MKVQALNLCVFLLLTLSVNLWADYHVDGKNGDDNNRGTADSPWATLEKARRTVKGPAKVIVHDGHYRAFIEDKSRGSTEFLEYVAAPGARPRLEGIDIHYPEPSDSYVSFDGFDIFSTRRLRLVQVVNARHLIIRNSELHADHWSRGPDDGVYAINLRRTENVLIERNRFYEVFRGVLIRKSNHVTVRGNFITVTGSSGIIYMSQSRNGLIENNHITGRDYVRYPEDPLAYHKPHQSIIAISANDLVVRGNLLHGIGNSSGMMLYQNDMPTDVTAYRNILIESNALYDTSNNSALRIYNLGDNVILRNNFFFSKKRPGKCDGVTNDGHYRYNVALNVHSVAEGFDGSGLKLYNNIFLGAAMIPPAAEERSNVFWSLKRGKRWQARPIDKASRLIVGRDRGCGEHPMLMENGGFFRVRNDLTFPEKSVLDLTPSAAPEEWQNVAAEQLPEYFLAPLQESGFLGAPVVRKQVLRPVPGPVQLTESSTAEMPNTRATGTSP
ncbi:right-handed parallel beta-helix repeat-containing protein [Microbulbifer agarilyticus]|uniref:right-handed parallel beta-helix repeat-containing protein n=1 Tax=Microbulbifer agarilyticus TaxID=260552 RepID=UPI001CD772B0|nr:right-handed parallel beta-helix repeat-containing protein [Microbulbifer agarilyticus]MCA0902153.1 right-handed parallel beta-helix repeat-containing protein [Microbulbifer agarilyticus]